MEKKTAMYNGKLVQVEECNPGWLGVINIMLHQYRKDFSDSSVKNLSEHETEFKRMAKIADERNLMTTAINNKLEAIDIAMKSMETIHLYHLKDSYKCLISQRDLLVSIIKEVKEK